MYRFSSRLNLYINTNPLLVSGRVIKAAQRLGVPLEWDDLGYVCGVSYDLARGLARELGSTMLSLEEYMHLAKEIPEVISHDFAEWLSDTYVIDQGSETPEHYPDTNKLRVNTTGLEETLEETSGKVIIPVGRPGWFDLSDVDSNGIPTRLHTTSSPGNWKFWSLGHTGHTSGALRNFVTSSGACSLDLGVPVFAKHPKIMIRECYQNLAPSIPSPMLALWKKYEALTLSKDDVAIRAFLEKIPVEELELITHESTDEFLAHKELEMKVDLRGKRAILAGLDHQLPKIRPAVMLQVLQQKTSEDAMYVLGHPRPDSDSVLSAVFEAIRRSLQYPDRTCLPWTESIPREVRPLLGEEAATYLSRIPEPEPHHDIVLVDCHQVPTGRQMNVKAIIDHHIIRRKFPSYVAISHEVSWSSTVQVYIKILGSGWELSAEMAKILLDATVLEAEPSLLVYMSEIDRLAISRLERIAGHVSCYNSLMTTMIHDADVEEMFYQDYRQSLFGFAVVKTKTSRNYYELAKTNNARESLPLTVVKEITYSTNFDEIQTEKISFIFNPDYHDKGFCRAVLTVVYAAYQRFHGSCTLNWDASIEIHHAKHQTPRLLLMPLIEGIVEEHLRFAYVSSLRKYLAMGFYNGSDTIYGNPGEGNAVHTEMSYNEAKTLIQSSDISMLSLADYWVAYKELSDRGFLHALRSLQDGQYVELLDTEITNCQGIRSGPKFLGNFQIESARPALIHPMDGTYSTGIPRALRSPDTYGDRSLWRYWSPDSEVNVATRGHIFVMDQTCIDLKVRPAERTKQLTFRPVYRDIPEIKFEIENESTNWIKVVIYPRLFSVFAREET